jgi:hypothetical protein
MISSKKNANENPLSFRKYSVTDFPKMRIFFHNRETSIDDKTVSHPLAFACHPAFSCPLPGEHVV